VTPVEQFFDAIEHSGLSLWVRGESLAAFPTILTIHTIGMGFLAGTSTAIGLRILGVAKAVSLPVLERFYPIIWLAFGANLISGLLLLAGYPYKAFTNPVFYVKLSFITLAIVLVLKVRNEVLRVFQEVPPPHNPLWRRAQRLAALSIFCWAGAITSGRLLAYTFKWLRVGIPGGF
jgi:hypothetical protein